MNDKKSTRHNIEIKKKGEPMKQNMGNLLRPFNGQC